MGGPAVSDRDALCGLVENGVSMGTHSRTYPILDRMLLEHASAEILGSQRDLEPEIGEFSPIFASANGGLSDEVVDALTRTGGA